MMRLRRPGVLQILTCCLVLTSAAWGAPRLVVEQPQYDFGPVIQGTSVPHVFQFTNQGDSLLQITRLRSSCGCTAALLSSRQLEPGATGEIRTTFNSAGFRGPISKTITLYTNDPAQPVARFELRGIVRELVALSPQQINFGSIDTGQQASSEVMLTNQSDQTLVLSAPISTDPGLQATLAPLNLEPGQQAVLRVNYLAVPGQVRFSGYVVVGISSPAAKDLRIPVYAQSQ